MKFHINKLHIWFEKELPIRTIEFQNNKVNVITGSSSTGKSNILAIIDYCLCSTSPRIVTPVINESAKWYGLEFVANGKYYAIARKKPTEETAESNIFRQNEPFSPGFYPTTSNIQISDLRKELDSLFGLKEEYRTPHIEGVPNAKVSFRSFLIFNALTEAIITNPHLFTDYNYFDQVYVKQKAQRDYLFDVVLGMDNVVQNKKIKQLNSLNTLKDEIEKTNNKGKKYERKFTEKRKEIEQLLIGYLPTNETDEDSFTPNDWVEYFENFLSKNVPNDIQNEKLSDLQDKLDKLILLRDNVNEARKEIKKYLTQGDKLISSLKPVEYIKRKEQELGSSYWTKAIIKAFEDSLKDEIDTMKSVYDQDILTERRYNDLSKEIDETSKIISSLTNKNGFSESKRQDFFYKLGCLNSLIEDLKNYRDKLSNSPIKNFSAEQKSELETLKTQINEFRTKRSEKIYSLNQTVQNIYDEFKYMEYYQGCQAKYSLETEKLVLNRSQAIYSEENIGSQSNYMFLHLCFFLGLHQYMIEQKNRYIGQFLFIDQLSAPYYAGSEKVKTTDEDKLLDAFKAINRFMNHVIVDCKEEFQIILIEHAPESYWINESTGKSKDELNHFVTIEQFIQDNALIPLNMIK